MTAYNQLGMSLLELVIAAMLESLLLLILLPHYLLLQKLYQQQSELTAFTKAKYLLTTIFRPNMPLAQLQQFCQHNAKDHMSLQPLLFQQSLQAYTLQTLPKEFKNVVATKRPIANSMILIITKFINRYPLQVDVVAGSNQLPLFNNIVATNPGLIISNCQRSERLDYYPGDGQRLHLRQKLRHSYQQQNSHIYLIEELIIFVKGSKRTNYQQQPTLSLYLIRNRGKADELIAAIQKLSLQSSTALLTASAAQPIVPAMVTRKQQAIGYKQLITITPQCRYLPPHSWQIPLPTDAYETTYVNK